MFNRLKKDILEVLFIVLNIVQQDVQTMGPVMAATHQQIQIAKDLAEVGLDKLLISVDSALQSNQLALSRLICPSIQKGMAAIYAAALHEKGRGSLTRRRVSTTFRNFKCVIQAFLMCKQDVLCAFVAEHADKLYAGTVEVIAEGLKKAISDIEKSVNRQLDQLAERVSLFVSKTLQRTAMIFHID